MCKIKGGGVIIQLVLQFLYAFASTLLFAVVFSAPKKELLFCGFAGALGWIMFLITRDMLGWQSVAPFAGSFIVTVVSRYLAAIRKMPATVYLISGIIPFVPGAGMYYTMNAIITNTGDAAAQGTSTLKTAGLIALAIVIVFSIPNWFFTISLFKVRRSNEK